MLEGLALKLLVAAREGDTDQLLAALNEGVDINVRDLRGHTALHRAIDGGHVEVVKVLLKRGAILEPTINFKEAKEFMYAVRKRYPELQDLLKAANAHLDWAEIDANPITLGDAILFKDLRR